MSDSVSVPINGQRKGGGQANKTTRSLWKRRGKQALEPEEGGYRTLFWGGKMALRGRCKRLCDLSGRERKREKEQKTSFLKKGT